MPTLTQTVLLLAEPFSTKHEVDALGGKTSDNMRGVPKKRFLGPRLRGLVAPVLGITRVISKAGARAAVPRSTPLGKLYVCVFQGGAGRTGFHRHLRAGVLRVPRLHVIGFYFIGVYFGQGHVPVGFCLGPPHAQSESA